MSCGHFTELWGLDFARLWVWISADVFQQNHLHTDVWVPAWECTMPPGLVRMSLWCVTCGCHGDAFKNAGRAEVIVQRVGAKSRLVTRLTQCCSVRQSDRPPPPPPRAAGGLCLYAHSHTHKALSLLCKYAQINSSTSANRPIHIALRSYYSLLDPNDLTSSFSIMLFRYMQDTGSRIK